TVSLIPSFRSIKENLEEVTWVYYISAKNFFNLYPQDESFEYPEGIYEMQFFTQALPENNPQRKISWTDAYLDLAGQGMMVTADAPVYEGNQFRGIVALDITLQRLNQVIQDFDYPNGKIFIADANQQLLAFPTSGTSDVADIRTLNEVLPLELSHYIEGVFNSPDHHLKTIGSFLVAHQAIPNTPWHLVFYVPKQSIYFEIVANSLLASLIPLLGLGICLVVANYLLNYGFIQPACQLVDHIEQEKQSLHPKISTDVPEIWMPWFESISSAFQENRDLLAALENQLDMLKATQLQLVQSEKMSALGNLVAGIAHEINNPLGFVSGNVTELQLSLKDIVDYMQLLEQELSQPNDKISQARNDLEIEFLLDDLPAMLASMESGCDRILNISQSLRLFARSDDEAKFKANVHESINSTLLILKYRLQANDKRPKIEVICNYGELPDIDCFPGQLSQVFMNILANAVDMFDERADTISPDKLRLNPQKIVISTQSIPSKGVEIRIQDNGNGMPKEICEKIFDRKFTTKTVGKGTGLGLAISHQVIKESHHGTIDVCSHLNEGTEFIIFLPLVNETDDSQIS
ncbi:MAG: ATP-binding protein, partial [Cyanobacteria bacterium P01_D01_bin.56]